jgi:hypothetical protein
VKDLLWSGQREIKKGKKKKEKNRRPSFWILDIVSFTILRMTVLNHILLLCVLFHVVLSLEEPSCSDTDTDWAAVETKLATTQRKLKDAVAARDYATAGTLQSEETDLQKQFKLVYQAHRRCSNGTISLVPAHEMEQIRVKVWTDYIHKTLTPSLELAVSKLLHVAQREVSNTAATGRSMTFLYGFVGAATSEQHLLAQHGVSANSDHQLAKIEGDEFETLKIVAKSRVASMNFFWHLKQAGYSATPPANRHYGRQHGVQPGSFVPFLQITFNPRFTTHIIQELFVTYFETEYKKTAPRNTARRGQKDEHGNTASGAPLKLGSLPETDTVVLL